MVEVLYSIQAITPSSVDREQAQGRLKELLDEGYSLENMNRFQVSIQAEAEGVATQERTSEWGGMKLVSPDKRRVIHFMREGLFVSFLPPYPGFPQCISEVQRLWQIYSDGFAPERIVRTGIRYINQVGIPLDEGVVRFERYFKLLTFYPIDGPFTLHRFYNQFEVSEPKFGLPARVIFSSIKETTEQLDVVLDIEAYEEHARPVNDPEIWSRFDKARHWAYTLFTNTLTEECFQRFK